MYTKFWSESSKGRPKHGREYSIEVFVRDIGREDIDWTHIIQDKLQ